MSIIALDPPALDPHPLDPHALDPHPLDPHALGPHPLDPPAIDSGPSIDPVPVSEAPSISNAAPPLESARPDAEPVRAAGLRSAIRRSIAAVLTALVLLGAFVDTLINRLIDHATVSDRRRLTGQRGQATTEYALVLLGAALVALLLVAWATAGGGGARINRLFNRVIDAVVSRV